MKIAFVGLNVDWGDFHKRDYTSRFVKFHLELPYYYARDGNNQVWIVTNCYENPWSETWKNNDGLVLTQTPEQFDRNDIQFDVVIHWRKWHEDQYRPEAINVINSQDHSYSQEWLQKVEKASKEKKLEGILCFPTWHKENLAKELSGMYGDAPSLLEGVTLGVDTGIYKPAKKNHRELLWASDIGRGLFNGGFLNIAAELFKRDQKFKSHVCYPDYTDAGDRFEIGHPAIELHKNLDNGPELWNLFNTCGFLPYTSTFPEPSSRAHRQAMAAGCVVLYPPSMGTPSNLIIDGVTGFVRPVDEWADIIWELSRDENKFNEISQNAREVACLENWKVQAKRFNKLFEGLLNDR